MRAYIQGMGNISPQRTWPGDPFFELPIRVTGNRLVCQEPDYSLWINHPQLRRMSRVLKLGNAAAAMALKDADLVLVDAIITGTGYGCQEDTATFLSKITGQNETALNPTPFMQSTHNTIGSQIALVLQCQGYNQTYVHDAFSFEHSLLDAMMQISEAPATKILVGGVDELTDAGHEIKNRFRIYHQDNNDSLKLFEQASSGALDGEGAAYFVLSGVPSKNSKAVIEGVVTVYDPSKSELAFALDSFLQRHHVEKESIDFVLAGKSGFSQIDKNTDVLLRDHLSGCHVGLYKHLSGEHCVASSFALWLAAKIIREQTVPLIVAPSHAHRQYNTILIYNPYFYNHHAFILVKRCSHISA